MIGDVYFIGKEAYLHVNNSGTMERLYPIKWYGRLLFEVLSGIGRKLSLGDTLKLLDKFRIPGPHVYVNEKRIY